VQVGGLQIHVSVTTLQRPVQECLHLLTTLERTQSNTGQLPDALIAGAGYCSTDNLKACKGVQVEAYISTSRQQHSQWPGLSRGRPPKDLDASGRMERKLRSKAAQAIYAVRKTVVKPVFGQIKGARGLDQFRLRGLEQVNSERTLMATTRNILKLLRATMANA